MTAFQDPKYVAMFRTQCVEANSRIEAAIEAHDRETIAFQAHGIAGSAALLGDHPLGEAALALEYACRDGLPWPSIQEKWQVFRHAVERSPI